MVWLSPELELSFVIVLTLSRRQAMHEKDKSTIRGEGLVLLNIIG